MTDHELKAENVDWTRLTTPLGRARWILSMTLVGTTAEVDAFDDLVSQRETLRKALRYYATPGFSRDDGARARAALTDTRRPAEGESRKSGQESAFLGQADRAGRPGVRGVSPHDCKPLPGRPLPGPANPVGVCDLCGYDEGETP